MNKFNLFRLVLVVACLLNIVFLSFEIYLIKMGGVILYAHPLLPSSEWGSLKIRTPIFQIIVTFVTLLYIALIPKKEIVIEERMTVIETMDELDRIKNKKAFDKKFKRGR